MTTIDLSHFYKGENIARDENGFIVGKRFIVFVSDIMTHFYGFKIHKYTVPEKLLHTFQRLQKVIDFDAEDYAVVIFNCSIHKLDAIYTRIRVYQNKYYMRTFTRNIADHCHTHEEYIQFFIHEINRWLDHYENADEKHRHAAVSFLLMSLEKSLLSDEQYYACKRELSNLVLSCIA